MIQHHGDPQRGSAGPAGGRDGSPGKRTLTQSLTPRTLVARSASGVGGGSGAEAAVARADGDGGAPLRGDLRERFESSLGADLSAVRIHTGSSAAEASAALGARAYATGHDVHFGAGQYQPDDPFGLHLLAHEVAHTQQQAGTAGSRQAKLEVSRPGDPAEVDADRAADAMVAGHPTSVTPVAVGAVYREASCDQTSQVLALIDSLTSLDDIRDLKYAIDDCELDDEAQTRTITFRDLSYVVSLHGAEQIFEAIRQKESDTMGFTPALAGSSLAERVSLAISTSDYDLMYRLRDALDETLIFYAGNPSADWLVHLDGEELRSSQVGVADARKQLEPHLPKSIDERKPAGVDLNSLNAGFYLAPDRTIADGLATGSNGSSVWIGLTRQQLGIRFSPPLKTSFGPLPTADLDSIALLFISGAVVVKADGATEGLVESAVRDQIYKLIAGSGFEKAQYDPFADPWLPQRFAAFQAKLTSGGGPRDADAVGGKDVSGMYAGVQLQLDAVSKLDDKQTGLVIDGGTKVTVTFRSGARDATGDLAVMGKVDVTIPSGATLVKEGKPVVKLKKLSVGKGCAVKVEQYELLGDAKSAGDLESVLRLMAGAAKLASGGVPDGVAVEAASRGDNSPELVKGVARYEIEKQFSAEVRKMVEAGGDMVIEGKKLRDIMGL